MAIPDHPWTKATREAAAVRIAMTVAAKGAHEGVLFETKEEEALDTDEPIVELSETRGTINGDLTIGVDVTKAKALRANEGIGHDGVKLHGAGFIVTPAEAAHLGLGRRPGLEHHVRPYRNGRDLAGRPRGVMVIDLFGLDADEVRKRFPEVYQHILANVKEAKDEDGKPNGRDVNNRESYKVNWWIFGEPRRELRPALAGLARYIVTVDTARHRVFQFLPVEIICDDKSVIIANADAYVLGVLSSRIHILWSLRTGGWLGVGNDSVYTKTRTFDPFPFPDASDSLKAKIRATAEELDALRKRVQAEHPALTLTQIYNVLEKLRAGALLDDNDEAIKAKGLVLILRELHDKLDALVADAYGWPADLSDEDILGKLVALNAKRAAEEKRGVVRWLRPDYQRQRAGIAAEGARAPAEEQIEAPLVAAAAKIQKPSFPSGDVERTACVFAALMAAGGPLDSRTVAKGFRQGAKVEPAIRRVLASLARLGHVHTNDGRAFALRRSG